MKFIKNSKFYVDEVGMDKSTVSVADEVAYDILHPIIENNKLFLAILIIFLVLLISSISFVCFSVANHYRNIKDNSIVEGSILYSFNERSNYINIEDMYPISDELGKKLNDEEEKYEFIVSVNYNGVDDGVKTNYEVSIIPDISSTIPKDKIRVYLEKNKEPVLINGKEVNYLSDLDESTIRTNGYTLIKNAISGDSYDEYVFRMWLAPNYSVDGVERTFKCFIGVNDY